MNRRYSDGEHDEELVRAHLSGLVEGIEPAPDALPRLLATRRSRRRPRRGVVAAVGMAAVITVLVLISPVVIPLVRGNDSAPIGAGRDGYVAQTRAGVLAVVDLGSGRVRHEIAHLPGPVTDVAVDGERMYAAVSGRGVIEITSPGTPRRSALLPATEPVAALAASRDRVAVATRRAVLVRDGGNVRRIELPRDVRVVDLAIGSGGALAVLTVPENTSGRRGARLRTVDPGAGSMDPDPLTLPSLCPPLAVAGTEQGIAVLRRVRCEQPGQVRVGVLELGTGSRVAGGKPFDPGTRPLLPGRVRLSADEFGRILLSTAGGEVWLVDGAHVRSLPSPCGHTGECRGSPAAM